MKKNTVYWAMALALCVPITHATAVSTYINKAQQLKLDQDLTWQRLMYVQPNATSEVQFSGYFYSPDGQTNSIQELQENITALFQPAAANQSIRCKFPARSQFLIHKLQIQQTDLPVVDCPEFDTWINTIQPHKVVLIYATDFMGNPSSMFGHTLLRIDPAEEKNLNLVSFAVNYAATVQTNASWSYAWKGLTGQYPGEYSLMPYYRKVKEYGDFESRDLWEYELNLNPNETRFLVSHLWEMKQVNFPYYFTHDNCAYRLLGLIDLVRPNLNLQQAFKLATIPIESIKAIADADLIKSTTYRPALETQLMTQAHVHGRKLARQAHDLSNLSTTEIKQKLQNYTQLEQAKILEMAYDHLYLQFLARKVAQDIAQPQLRQLLILRSGLKLEKQRPVSPVPTFNPVDGHHARQIGIAVGQVQKHQTTELNLRYAYHDLIDPPFGYRLGSELKFLDVDLQLREKHLKLAQFDILSVNSYHPISAFKTPLSWGFDLSWQQESLDQGKFSTQHQHGVANLTTQFGLSKANEQQQHLCYAQLQNHLQIGKALANDWRWAVGPVIGCQQQWTAQWNSVWRLQMPYWSDHHQWHLKTDVELQYIFHPQQTLRINYHYEQQKQQHWDQFSLKYLWFF